MGLQDGGSEVGGAVGTTEGLTVDELLVGLMEVVGEEDVWTTVGKKELVTDGELEAFDGLRVVGADVGAPEGPAVRQFEGKEVVGSFVGTELGASEEGFADGGVVRVLDGAKVG